MVKNVSLTCFWDVVNILFSDNIFRFRISSSGVILNLKMKFISNYMLETEKGQIRFNFQIAKNKVLFTLIESSDFEMTRP